jgi:hypothetical protein
MLLFEHGESALLGTVHLLPKVYETSVHEIVKDLVARSSRVVLECRFSEPGYEPPHARLEHGERLHDLVDGRLLAEAIEAAAALGITADDLATCRPWWAAERLGAAATTALQLTAQASCELIAARCAWAAGKEVCVLEPMERGYLCRSQSPLSEQLWALEYEVRGSENCRNELEQMVEAFGTGNLSFWERFLALGTQRQPRTADCMFRQRNLEWTPNLLSVLSKGPALIIVGALHLPSNTGLLALLRQHGYTFQR